MGECSADRQNRQHQCNEGCIRRTHALPSQQHLVGTCRHGYVHCVQTSNRDHVHGLQPRYQVPDREAVKSCMPSKLATPPASHWRKQQEVGGPYAGSQRTTPTAAQRAACLIRGLHISSEGRSKIGEARNQCSEQRACGRAQNSLKKSDSREKKPVSPVPSTKLRPSGDMLSPWRRARCNRTVNHYTAPHRTPSRHWVHELLTQHNQAPVRQGGVACSRLEVRGGLYGHMARGGVGRGAGGEIAPQRGRAEHTRSQFFVHTCRLAGDC